MSGFKYLFSPAKTKDGFSRLTFLDYEIISFFGGSAITNLTFEVMGLLKGTKEKVTVVLGAHYEPDNLLGKTLAAMGYELKLKKDADDFEQIESSNLEDIDQFLSSRKNSIYAARLGYKGMEGNGSWEVDVETLKLIHLP